MSQALPHQRKLHGISIHYTGEPTTTKWYTHGSEQQGRAGGGIYNGNYRAAFRIHGPQQVCRAETIACALAFELANEGDEIVLDYQGVIKATPIKRKGVVKDQDYRDIGYQNASTKRLTIQWTPGHRTLEQAAIATIRTYKGRTTLMSLRIWATTCPWIPNNHNPTILSLSDKSCPRLQEQHEKASHHPCSTGGRKAGGVVA